VVRVPSDDHLLKLADGRIIGYATWGDPEGVARAHRPLNSGVASGPLRGPRRPGVGSQAGSFQESRSLGTSVSFL
jgi:hypothetical protein